jgi:hypothetical protein
MSGIIGDNLGRSGGLIKSGAAGGAWTLIDDSSVSSSVSSLSIDEVFTSSYDLYQLFGYAIYTNTTAEQPLAFRYIKSDGSVDSGGNYEMIRHGIVRTGSTSAIDDASTSADWHKFGNYVGISDATTNSAFNITFFNPQSTSDEKISIAQWMSKGASGYIDLEHSGCSYNQDSTAVRGIQILSNTNLLGGEFKLYGMQTT